MDQVSRNFGRQPHAAHQPTTFSAGEQVDRMTMIIERGRQKFAPKSDAIQQLGGYDSIRQLVADAIARKQITPADKTPKGGKNS